MNYFTLLDEGELLSLHWDPIVLLQAGPVKSTIPAVEHILLKEESRWDSRSGIPCPSPILP